MSEGGLNPSGYSHAVTTGTTPISVSNAGNGEALLGIRLKSTHAGVTISPKSLNIITTDNAAFRWYVTFNPTLGGTSPTWTSFASHSGVEYAIAVGDNVVSNMGSVLLEGWSGGSSAGMGNVIELSSLLKLGFSIAGVADTLWVCAQPIAGPTKNFHASLGWTELA
jgi:hypothetical protein